MKTCAICGHRDAMCWTEWDETRWVASCAHCQRDVEREDGDLGHVTFDDLSIASKAVWIARRVPGLTCIEICKYLGVTSHRDERYNAVCRGLSFAVRRGHLRANEAFYTRRYEGISGGREYYPTSKRWVPLGFERTKKIAALERTALREIAREART